MNKIKQFLDKNIHGKVDKPTFIKEMYENYHAILFSYAEILAKTNIKKIEVEDNLVVMTTRDRGVKIVCAAGDFRTAPIEALNFSDYEKSDSKMIENLISDGDTFFDIGANIGWYSINVALANRLSKIFSFEPIPKTYKYLLKNLAMNPSSNISAYNFGFSNKVGEFDFFYYPEGSGNASSANVTGRDDIEVVKCQLKTLDKFCMDTESRIDFIKCDVEGAELFVFEGGREVIDRDQPIIFSEILRKWVAKFDYDPNDIFDFFSHKGYRSFIVKNGYLIEFDSMTPETVETNFFFLHSEKHRDKIQKYVKI